MNILKTITTGISIIEGLVSAFTHAKPNGLVEDATAFVQKNADLLIDHLVTNPTLAKDVDAVVNELIGEVPAIFEKQKTSTPYTTVAQ
jgi:hypothetical protein